MKVGDLVKNRNLRRCSVGIVTAIGYGKNWKTYIESEYINPDVWVLTALGERRWPYCWLTVVSEYSCKTSLSVV